MTELESSEVWWGPPEPAVEFRAGADGARRAVADGERDEHGGVEREDDEVDEEHGPDEQRDVVVAARGREAEVRGALAVVVVEAWAAKERFNVASP